MLAGVPAQLRQRILDETEGRIRAERRGMPVVYDDLRFLASLCRAALKGEFQANLALSVEAEREARAASANARSCLRRTRGANARPALRPRNRPSPSCAQCSAWPTLRVDTVCPLGSRNRICNGRARDLGSRGAHEDRPWTAMSLYKQRRHALIELGGA